MEQKINSRSCGLGFRATDSEYRAVFTYAGKNGGCELKDLSFLDTEDMKYISPIRKPSHRDDVIVGRYAAKKAVAELAGTDIGDISISKGVFSQPLALNEPGGRFQVTVTHTGGAAAAVAYPDELIIGIDMEKELSQEMKNSLTLSEEESRAVDELGLDTTIFWTVREALIKCLKLSLFFSPKLLELTEIRREGELVTGTFRYFGQYSFQAVSRDGVSIGMVIPKRTDMLPALDEIADDIADMVSA
ncbi:MAG: 4'-phosphopantetheinyl transferase superfamily protein [Ruminococcus sp.]|nr:4'-phosphopantetheinyl transferase superfamily protein [Ruminococcus sp.]